MSLVLKLDAYFEQVATSHSSINHTDKNPRYSRFNVSELGQISKHVPHGGVILQLSESSGKLIGDSDSAIPFTSFGFLVWVKHPKGDFTKEVAAFDKSMSIGFEILAKLLKDHADGCEIFTGLDTGSVSFDMVDTLDISGYWFKLTLKDFNSLISYNEDLWQ